jgi:hypothetical protein
MALRYDEVDISLLLLPNMLFLFFHVDQPLLLPPVITHSVYSTRCLLWCALHSKGHPTRAGPRSSLLCSHGWHGDFSFWLRDFQSRDCTRRCEELGQKFRPANSIIFSSTSSMLEQTMTLARIARFRRSRAGVSWRVGRRLPSPSKCWRRCLRARMLPSLSYSTTKWKINCTMFTKRLIVVFFFAARERAKYGRIYWN